MRTKQQAFNIDRVKEFCKRINNGESPTEALKNMNASRAYGTPLRRAGLFWTEKDGTYKAVERVYAERYELFSTERKKFNNKNFARYLEKQTTLFNQPKAKQPTAKKVKQPQLNFIQRVVKSIFNL